jgi:transposase
VPEEPGLAVVIAEQGELLARLHAVVEAKDAEKQVLRAELDAARERERRLGLRLAELERRLRMDSSDSGMPGSKEPIGAKERRRAERQESERERRKDRRRGGQPGHPGRRLARDPDPGERKDADPPAQCRRCGAGLDGAAPAAPGWAQVVDVRVTKTVTEWTLPGLECPCCGTATIAGPPPGVHAGSVSYGPALNGAAVVLTGYGNVPPGRAAHVMDMLLGVPVSAGWVDKASARLSRHLGQAGFDAVMRAALAAEPVLAADETPVNVLAPGAVPQAAGQEEQDPEDGGKTACGAPHVLVIRTPGERLTWLRALGSRRKEDVTAGVPALFTGFLITDGYRAYQQQRRAGRQRAKTPSGRLRVLAHPRHPRPMVPHPQLHRLSHEPRPQRPGRHPRRARRKTLATTTPRTGVTPNHATREWTPTAASWTGLRPLWAPRH